MARKRIVSRTFKGIKLTLIVCSKSDYQISEKEIIIPCCTYNINKIRNNLDKYSTPEYKVIDLKNYSGFEELRGIEEQEFYNISKPLDPVTRNFMLEEVSE